MALTALDVRPEEALTPSKPQPIMGPLTAEDHPTCLSTSSFQQNTQTHRTKPATHTSPPPPPPLPEKLALPLPHTTHPLPQVEKQIHTTSQPASQALQTLEHAFGRIGRINLREVRALHLGLPALQLRV